MKKIVVAIAILIICSFVVCATPLVEDDFSDGDYTANPTWHAQTGGWTASTYRLETVDEENERLIDINASFPEDATGWNLSLAFYIVKADMDGCRVFFGDEWGTTNTVYPNIGYQFIMGTLNRDWINSLFRLENNSDLVAIDLSGTPFNAGQWYNLRWVFQNGTHSIYIDDNLWVQGFDDKFGPEELGKLMLASNTGGIPGDKQRCKYDNITLYAIYDEPEEECTDDDEDGISTDGGECGMIDNCPSDYNPDQENSDVYKDAYYDDETREDTTMKLGKSDTVYSVAQSFKVDSAIDVSKVELYIGNYRNANFNIVVSIQTDNNNKPSGIIVDNITKEINLSTFSGGWGRRWWRTIEFENYPSLSADTKYWLVFMAPSTAVNYADVGVDTPTGFAASYDDGDAALYYWGAWQRVYNGTTYAKQDLLFRIYGTDGTGDACDTDDDDDSVLDTSDDCPVDYSTADSGCPCNDDDSDAIFNEGGFCGIPDNCVGLSNPDQNNSDVVEVESYDNTADKDSSVNLGASDTSYSAAQSFKVDEAMAISKVDVYLGDYRGADFLVEVTIQTDNNNKPSGTIVDDSIAILNLSKTSNSWGQFSWVSVYFKDLPQLDADTKYWLVLMAPGDVTTRAELGTDGSSPTYADGDYALYYWGAWQRVYNGTTYAAKDMLFRIYSGDEEGDACEEEPSEPLLLLNVGKPAYAPNFSSSDTPSRSNDDNLLTYWHSASYYKNQWIAYDLEDEYSIHTISIFTASDRGLKNKKWYLEGSDDNESWVRVQDFDSASPIDPSNRVTGTNYSVANNNTFFRFWRIRLTNEDSNQAWAFYELHLFGKSQIRDDQVDIYDITCDNCHTYFDYDTEPYITSSLTPTLSFDTNVDAWCRIGLQDQSWSDMGSSRDCVTGEGSKSHTCTLTEQDSWDESADVYISCKDSTGDQRTSSALGVEEAITTTDALLNIGKPATAKDNYENDPASESNDNDKSTFWHATSYGANWIKYDLQSNYSVTMLAIFTDEDRGTNSAWYLKGSKDNVNFVTVQSFEAENPLDRTHYTEGTNYSVSNTTDMFRYWKIEFMDEENNQQWDMRELHIYGNQGEPPEEPDPEEAYLYWSFDDSSNPTADDSGNGRTGTVSGALYTTELQKCGSGAYIFDGVNDEIYTSNNLGISGNDARTVNFWAYINTTADQNRHFFGWGSTLTGSVFSLKQDTDGSLFFVGWSSAYDYDTGYVLPTEKWIMLTVKTNTTHLSLYVNGSIIGSPQERTYSTTDSPLYLGRWHMPYNYFAGRIDELSVWDRPLNDSEIEGLYNEGDCYNPYE